MAKTTIKNRVLAACFVWLLVTGFIIVFILTQNQNNPKASLVSARNFLDIADCLNQSGESRTACLDNFVYGFATQAGFSVQQLLAVMEESRHASVQIENECHVVAHAVGRYAYSQTTSVGDAFEACNQSCHSGCYHGVMERLFYSEEEVNNETRHLSLDDLNTKVPGVCDQSKFTNPSNAVVFQCLHGLGHAILYSLDYNLVDSLAACDLLSTLYERSSCYGGVIMENVTAFDKSKRDIAMADPHYPCNKLAAKYKYDCYMMQTSIMLEQGLTSSQIAEQCLSAGDYTKACLMSMGRDLSNYVRTDQIQKVVSACEAVGGDNKLHCIQGVIYALVDNTWDGKWAMPFCNSLTNQTNRQACFASLSSYLKSAYAYSQDKVAADCDIYAQSSAWCYL